ncbi:hypothetical protein [Nesterenkonia haasae]|uniref:hypothetical protein n=1 Tax=Nesterenkonia haasae TaxID=2587813 RepID=UPI0013919277|nr:hypothetical protein [Nesterenkonia haasae]NDK33179.1 hypothetical protein [Nesterenkonia haasae]
MACLIMLVATVVSAFAEEWKLAIACAAASFGLFTVLMLFTLAAMLRTLRLVRGRVRTIDHEIRQVRHMAAGVRRIDNRTAERFKMFEATEARVEAAERRLLATFEAHRFQLEDEVAELRKEQLSGH